MVGKNKGLKPFFSGSQVINGVFDQRILDPNFFITMFFFGGGNSGGNYLPVPLTIAGWKPNPRILVFPTVKSNDIYPRSTPHPVTVTTRIITFLVGNPYKPSFATVTGWGVDPTNTIQDGGFF